jgi:hypothetical protein
MFCACCCAGGEALTIFNFVLRGISIENKITLTRIIRPHRPLRRNGFVRTKRSESGKFVTLQLATLGILKRTPSLRLTSSVRIVATHTFSHSHCIAGSTSLTGFARESNDEDPNSVHIFSDYNIFYMHHQRDEHDQQQFER